MNNLKKGVNQKLKNDKPMDIFNPNQRQVMCVDTQPNSWCGGDSCELLGLDEIYYVVKIEVHSSHTRIYLSEFPNQWFNSVRFAEL